MRFGGPCQFNAKPTHGYCDGVSGIHIIDGSYGNDIKLDGFNTALIGSWPGPVHEGRGKASYYIYDRCNDRQFEALSQIITGRAGSGGPFLVYASTFFGSISSTLSNQLIASSYLPSLIRATPSLFEDEILQHKP